MDFRIADTFTDSLSRLTGDEQKAVKTTAFDLQLNPANPGFSFHKLDKAKDKNFWSVRVSSDLRLIVHRTSESLLLCYVDHTTKPTSGQSDAGWRPTPKLARLSSSRFARRFRRLSFRNMSKRPRSKLNGRSCFLRFLTPSCWGLAYLPSGFRMCVRLRKTHF
jgi:mRNA-degrading endonuclease RelE of RelBE toxin-antitoxin system